MYFCQAATQVNMVYRMILAPIATVSLVAYKWSTFFKMNTIFLTLVAVSIPS